jgi:hypothetical protein
MVHMEEGLALSGRRGKNRRGRGVLAAGSRLVKNRNRPVARKKMSRAQESNVTSLSGFRGFLVGIDIVFINCNDEPVVG